MAATSTPRGLVAAQPPVELHLRTLGPCRLEAGWSPRTGCSPTSGATARSRGACSPGGGGCKWWPRELQSPGCTVGAEPVVVDTGVIENRDQFLADVFSVVEPDDIRWVFISHDDVDHTGNLTPLVEAAPNATVVVNWFTWERMGATLEVPLDRMRWVDDGGSFDVGDRVLHAVRPPVFDSPTTRGLFDPTTGVYWGSDSFAAPLTELVTNADQVDPEAWEMGMAMFHQYISPWFAMLDDSLYQRSVDRVEDLGVKAIAGCHAPTVTGARVADAFRHIRTFGQVSVPAAPGQDVLDMMLGAVPAV
jgi:hypothetical protein